MIKSKKVMVGKHFYSLNRPMGRQSRGIKRKSLNKTSGKKLLHHLNHKLFNDLPNTLKFPTK